MRTSDFSLHQANTVNASQGAIYMAELQSNTQPKQVASQKLIGHRTPAMLSATRVLSTSGPPGKRLHRLYIICSTSVVSHVVEGQTDPLQGNQCIL